MIDPGDLRDVFDRAASLPPQDRAAFLARACGDNLALRQEVERLLAADARAGSLFTAEIPVTATAEREPVARARLRRTHGRAPASAPTSSSGPLGAGGMGEVYQRP